MRRLIKDQRGFVAYELIITIMAVMIMIVTGLHGLAAGMKYAEVDYAARRIARLIEVEGGVTSTVYDNFNKIKQEIKMPNAGFQVQDVQYFNASEKTIQLKETFKVVVTGEYELKVLDPTWGESLIYKIPLVSEKSGMSEVYHKP